MTESFFFRLDNRLSQMEMGKLRDNIKEKFGQSCGGAFSMSGDLTLQKKFKININYKDSEGVKCDPKNYFMKNKFKVMLGNKTYGKGSMIINLNPKNQKQFVRIAYNPSRGSVPESGIKLPLEVMNHLMEHHGLDFAYHERCLITGDKGTAVCVKPNK